MVIGYIFGCFLCIEVFELFFIFLNVEVGFCVFYEMFENEMKDEEFKDMYVFGVWIYGLGFFYLFKFIKNFEDLRGMKICGVFCMVNMLFEELGVMLVGMLVLVVLEFLLKGVIDVVILFWEVVLSLKVFEFVYNYMEFIGNVFYIVMFVFVMNNDIYVSFFDDLKKVIDNNLGFEFFVWVGVI